MWYLQMWVEIVGPADVTTVVLPDDVVPAAFNAGLNYAVLCCYGDCDVECQFFKSPQIQVCVSVDSG